MMTFLLLLDDFDSQLLLLVLDLFLGGGVCLFLKIKSYNNFKVDKNTCLTCPGADLCAIFVYDKG